MNQEHGYLQEYSKEQIDEAVMQVKQAVMQIKQALKETDVKACLRRLLEDQRRR